MFEGMQEHDQRCDNDTCPLVLGLPVNQQIKDTYPFPFWGVLMVVSSNIEDAALYFTLYSTGRIRDHHYQGTHSEQAGPGHHSR